MVVNIETNEIMWDRCNELIVVCDWKTLEKIEFLKYIAKLIGNEGLIENRFQM